MRFCSNQFTRAREKLERGSPRFFVIVLIISLITIFSDCSSSKRMGEKALINAKYQTTYRLNFINDTILMTQGTEDRFTYLIGDNITYGGASLLRNQYLNQIDSLGSASRLSYYIREELRAGSLPFSRFNGSDLMQIILYKDYKTKRINVIDYISNHYFIYEEDLTPQNWTIQYDTMTIAGYRCQNAICDYRGRSYEAWFTLDIPINEGPWKFYGLPGLIIKLFDTKHHYEFELVGFQKTDEKIDILPLFRKEVKRSPNTPSIAKLTKIERKEFLRMKFGEKGRLIMQTDMAQVGLQTENRVEKKFNYIELDYK